MAKDLSDKLLRELSDLKLIADEDIDLSDMPETTDWSSGLRGLWRSRSYDSLDYDIRAVANEILKRAWQAGAKPTNMWLNKVAWFVYERMLVDYGKLLSQARVEAWDHGPVFREIYSAAKNHGSEPIAELIQAFSIDARRMETASAAFDAVTSGVIDAAVESFRGKSGSQLRNSSHVEGSPWYRVWYSGKKMSAGMVISPNIILAAADARRDQDG